MLTCSLLIVAWAASCSVASSLSKRISPPVVDDEIILNYSLTIEFLQRAFYRDGLSSFQHAQFVSAGFQDPFYDNFLEIYSDEQAHVDFLNNTLHAAGFPATVELEYNFPYNDVESFVTLASILGGVATSAYLGAASSIVDKNYLTASESILGNSARHTAYLRATLGESPFGNGFDTPLPFNEVHSLAVEFITKNPNPVNLPFQAFPTLVVQCTPYYYEAGRSSVTFSGPRTNSSAPVYAVFFSGLQQASSAFFNSSDTDLLIYQIPVQVRTTASIVANGVINNKTSSVTYRVSQLPDGAIGQVYLVLSRSNTNFADQNILAGPAILEVYKKGKIPSTPHAQCN